MSWQERMFFLDGFDEFLQGFFEGFRVLVYF